MLLPVGAGQDQALEPAGNSWRETFEQLLDKYCRPDGVDFRAWYQSATDLAAIEFVTAGIASEEIADAGREVRMAFYLNAYNAWILRKILDDYPVDGPGGGGFVGRNLFFRAKSITVAGKRMSFDHLENEIIRPEFGDPRIHFALNCASASCPPLYRKAFRAADLDSVLDALASAYVQGNPEGLQIDHSARTVRLSRIFEWFREDFSRRGGVVSFINQYRDVPLPDGYEIRFQEYNWNLNQSRLSAEDDEG